MCAIIIRGDSMKLNNKGYAITTILYGTLIMFLMLMTSMMGILSTHKVRIEKLIEEDKGATEIVNEVVENSFPRSSNSLPSSLMSRPSLPSSSMSRPSSSASKPSSSVIKRWKYVLSFQCMGSPAANEESNYMSSKCKCCL